MEANELSPIRQYCEIATCMGITDCYLTKSIAGKVFWTILIIAGLSITIFQSYLTFAEYFNENSFSASMSKESMDNGIQFPNVTICNFNRARQSVINSTGLDPKALTAIFQLYQNAYDLPLSYIMNMSDIATYQAAMDNCLTNYPDMRNFYRKYGHTLSESILTTSFASGEAIHTARFTEAFNTYGRCWRLDVNRSQTLPGFNAGLKLMLNPQLNEYMSNVVWNNFFQQGFVISLGYTDDPIMSDVITLAPGTSVFITMKATRNSYANTQFPIKTKPCRKDGKLKISNAEYTRQNCIFDCYMRTINKTCGCILLVETRKPDKGPHDNLYSSGDVRLCNLTESLQCANSNPFDPKQSLWWAQNISSAIMECSKDCLNPCKEFLTIETAISTTKTVIKDKRQGLQILEDIGQLYNWTDEYVADVFENSIMAKIYFSTTDLAIIETGESTPIMTFIGNVGGQLGLWMGISMFSIIQVLFYIFLGCVKGNLRSKMKKVQDLPISKNNNNQI